MKINLQQKTGFHNGMGKHNNIDYEETFQNLSTANTVRLSKLRNLEIETKENRGCLNYLCDQSTMNLIWLK